jgi:glycosyltransferase involved in cell wall biosynthesis
MRIAVVGQKFNPSNPDFIKGGAERVELDHILMLSRAGHEVHFITSSDSKVQEPIRPHYVGTSKHALRKRTGPGRNAAVFQSIRQINPDVILLHDESSPTLNNALSKYDKPSIIFIHSSSFGGISCFGYYESLWAAAKNGHTVVCMSETSRVEHADFVRKYTEYFLKRGIIPLEDLKECAFLNAVLHPAVLWEKPEVKPITRGFASIGRIDKWKRHHIALRSADDVSVFAPTPWGGSADGEEVFTKLRKKFGESKFHLDLPHRDIMACLSESKALFVLGEESFSLVAVEANSRGAPVFLLPPKKGLHPAEEACSSGAEHESLIRFSSEKDLYDFVSAFTPYPEEQRLRIMEATWVRYNHASALRNLETLIQEATLRKRSFRQVEESPEGEDLLSIFGY